MLKEADYIYNNILIEDGIHTTLKYVKKNQNGCDLSIRRVLEPITSGIILNDKTYVNKYNEIEPQEYKIPGCPRSFKGWYLSCGKTYVVDLNEGVRMGATETGYVIQRSSLNRNGVTALSGLFDAGFTTQEGNVVLGASLRLIIDNPNGVYIEENSRIIQFIVFESEAPETLYDGQFQGGRSVSRLVEKEV